MNISKHKLSASVLINSKFSAINSYVPNAYSECFILIPLLLYSCDYVV